MFDIARLTLGLYSQPFWIAQVTPNDRAVTTPAEAAGLLSGPQFFVVLIAGIVLAFAFQLLLTNLSVAAGISYIGRRSDDDDDSDDQSSFGGTIRKVGKAVGIWTLVTVTIALFFACFLAVNLSLLSPLNAGLGAILGLVIWGAYFSLLVWVSSTTVGSLIGSVINTATSGFQAILGTATAALGAKAASQQVVATAEAAAAAVGRQLGAAIDPTSVRETLEDYLQTLRPPELDVQGVRKEFEKLLNNPQLKAIAPNNLRDINRQTFVDLVSNNTNLSKRDANRIADALQDTWNQAVNHTQGRDVMGELLDYLKSAQAKELRSPELNSKLDQLIAEMRSSRQATQEQTEKTPGLMGQARQMAMTAITGVLLGRSDLSDLDIQTILNRLQGLREQLTSGADKLSSQVKENIPALPGTPNTIRLDVENYLLNSYPWHFNRETIKHEFRQVIYDPDADPATVRRQLEQIKRSDFVDLLQSRGLFTQDELNQIADRLEEVRQEVLASVQYREKEERTLDLRTRVENYLRDTRYEDLNSDAIKRDFKAILSDSDASYEELRDRYSQFDRAAFLQILGQRPEITPEERDRIIGDLEQTRDRAIVEAKGLQDRAKAEAEALWLNLESYLRNTGKEELNPDGIKRDLATLLNNPTAGTYLIRARLSRFDRDTLVKLLSQRQDLSEDQVNQIIDRVQSTWNNVFHAPQVVVDKTKEQYDRVTTAISDYLRNTGKEELNPEGISRDLARLFNNPKEGSLALRSRLSQVDRDTLVKLLSQRQDLSEEQVNQIIDRVQDTIRSIVKAPRRFAQRTTATVRDFQATLEDYLRNTGKDALNPEGIKRDLSLVLHDPRTGMESLGDRLARIDRDTVISLLSQRPDISPEEAAQIVDRVLAVRDRFVEQVRSVQRQIQDAIDSVFAQIRNYLNSLDRPELNYDGIKRDVRQLFDDPQAGFDALRYRLSQFNRDTLVAILSSREDISEADANRLIDQIEGARNNVLQRAERIQQEAQRRVEDVKRQAAKQAEETRKAAESASWWLFGTALTSAVASAIAGAIAVGL
ncbi:MFS transporter [Aerosakkonema funiforme]|uniref:MFS transporter n=1 Tax=Aerosakkonema funiforme FACHB-1375 TaxID=2949571 RepID=A0A926VDC4_9CYAN|nr:MFS transporter [Aerosakkonema funiforme]MBD2181645.1 MFS transporter [Aerosakkonema funiforme FACHB-1375]